MALRNIMNCQTDDILRKKARAVEKQQEMEGCLSIPGIHGRVKRPEKVIVKAFDKNGQPFDSEGKGLLARALCHRITEEFKKRILKCKGFEVADKSMKIYRCCSSCKR